MYMYMYLYVYLYMYMYMYMYMCIYIYVYIFIYTYTYTCICWCLCLCLCIWMCILDLDGIAILLGSQMSFFFCRSHASHATQDWGSAADWLRLGPMLDPSASQHGGGCCSAAEGHPSGPGPSRGVPCRVLCFQRLSCPGWGGGAPDGHLVVAEELPAGAQGPGSKTRGDFF